MAEDSSERESRGSAGTSAKRGKKDARGWLIPEEGTFARDVYEMMNIGYTEAEIVMKTGATRDHVHVVRHDIMDGGERHRRTQKAYEERQKKDG